MDTSCSWVVGEIISQKWVNMVISPEDLKNSGLKVLNGQSQIFFLDIF
jgi:hypothetical protein